MHSIYAFHTNTFKIVFYLFRIFAISVISAAYTLDALCQMFQTFFYVMCFVDTMITCFQYKHQETKEHLHIEHAITKVSQQRATRNNECTLKTVEAPAADGLQCYTMIIKNKTLMCPIFYRGNWTAVSIAFVSFVSKFFLHPLSTDIHLCKLSEHRLLFSEGGEGSPSEPAD